MFKNDIKIAFRTLLKYKSYSAINVFGLTTALLCGIIVFVFIQQELTYDRYHSKSDNIYRITFEEINRPGARHFATTSPPMGPALVETFPEIIRAVRLRFVRNSLVEYEDRQFYETGVAYADSTFLSIFDFPLAFGDPETALRNINSVLLTDAMARKYFGDENPIGKSILLDNEKLLTVTGVFEPLNNKTHLKFDMVISFHSFEVPAGYPVTLNSWGWVSFYTYLLLENNTDTEALEAQFRDLLISNMGEDIGGNRLLHLQPLKEAYMASDLQNATTFMYTGNSRYVMGMFVVAFFLLLIACFNFMNLTTTHSLRRSKEVGIRKTLGGLRIGLVRQFLFESVLLAIVSVLIALLLAEPFSGFVSWLFNTELSISLNDLLSIVPIFLGIGLITGILAGIYPAFTLSALKPFNALKGDLSIKGSGPDLQTGIVVVQFSIAIFLIAGSIVIHKQLQHIRDLDLGFDEEQVIVIKMDETELTSRYPVLRNQIMQDANVVSVGLAAGLLDGNYGSVTVFPQDNEDEEGYPMYHHGVHYGYFETLNIEFVEGRPIDESYATDYDEGIVINEAAARALGWNEPLGRRLSIGDVKEGVVVGVAKDFHFASLHNEIRPLAMYIPPVNMDNLYIRVQPGNINEILSSLERTWSSVVPDFPFHFIFLDEHLNTLYQTDLRFFRLVTAFTILTIIVACLGLYGLINNFIIQRTKEIGIRKVLGATVVQIVFLLNKRFTILIIAATLFAWPISWFFLKRWIQNFAYQIELSGWIFLLSGLMALTIAWAAISYQSVMAALMNPVRSLKNE